MTRTASLATASSLPRDGADRSHANPDERLTELPTPAELLPTMRHSQTDAWFACGPLPMERQGWKLYVSMTILNAAEMIKLVVPIVAETGLHYKYVRSIARLRRLNAGVDGYSQVGKCLVIYMPEPDADLIRRLKAALGPYRYECPSVPFSISFGDGLPFYYRYGSYVDAKIEVDGREFRDVRDRARASIPGGVRDTLARFTSPTPEDHAVRSFLLRYPTFRALAQQGKSGLFVALNVASSVYEEVILKVGNHRGQVQPDGSDGCSMVRRELCFYRVLRERRIESVAPRLIDALDAERKVILALERIEGRTLLEQRLDGSLTVPTLEAAWRQLACVHDAGLYLGDAKIANVINTGPASVKLIDFEGGGLIGDRPSPVRTFFLGDLEPLDPCAADRMHFLASVLFRYEAGEYSRTSRRFDVGSAMSLTPDTEVSAWAKDRLGLEVSAA